MDGKSLSAGMALGVLVGFGAGYFTFSQAATPEVTAQVADDVRPPKGSHHAVIGPDVAMDSAPASPPRPPRPPEETVSAEARAAQETKLAALEADLAALRQQMGKRDEERTLAHEGKPIPKPASLPDRFEPDRMRRVFDQALKEAGFQSAQVSEVDCTEYPCILYGSGFGDRNDMEKLKGAAAFKEYDDDSTSVHGWGVGKKDAGVRNYFGVALYPDDADGGGGRNDDFDKRLDYRMRQYWEASKPR